MTISQSLANALSGLTAASRMAEVVSSNLANALTEGYGRRVLDLSAQSIGGVGAGVRIDGVTRIVDRGVLADRRLADSLLSGREMRAGSLARLETILGETGDETSVAGRITALEQALVDAGINPSSDVALGNVLDRLRGVAGALNTATKGIQAERLRAERAIADDVETLNRSLKQLEQANADIAQATNSGGDPSALMDQRQTIVDRIAAIVPVRELDRPHGQVALVTTGGQMLIDGKAQEFGFEPVHTMTADMTFASGALKGLTRNGVPIDPAKGIGLLDGGSLGAAFRLRDETLPAAQDDLDAIAADLMTRFEDPATDPTRAPGAAGLLTDAGAALDPLDTAGLAGRIAVNAVVDPTRGGALWRLRDGTGAATPGPVGRATQIEAWATALSSPRAIAGGATDSAAGHAARLSAAIGADRVVAEEEQAFASARWSALRETELAGGVDTDHEMQMLLRIEQAYAANARVVETLDAMMRTLMEI